MEDLTAGSNSAARYRGIVYFVRVLKRSCALRVRWNRYGCSYARRRMHPSRESRVVFSSTVQSFGVAPVATSSTKVSSECSTDGVLQLCDLPFELLRTIASYLDSFRFLSRFSFNIQLSDLFSCIAVYVTWLSRLGYSVMWPVHYCITEALSTHTGKRLAKDGGSLNLYALFRLETIYFAIPNWFILWQRWSFSTAFSPVEHWVFDDTDHLSNHIRQCRFYTK